MNKNYLKIVIVAVVVGLLSFYAGVRHGQATAPTDTNQARSGQFGNGGRVGGQRNGGIGGGFTAGQVLSKDANSITLQLRSGGSMIVLYSTSTQVQKSVSGSDSDLSVGEQVMVSGSANADGSLTAQSIQIRPENASSTVAR
ncbi:MAG: DUF5666 domain-containing protein [bacterium]